MPNRPPLDLSKLQTFVAVADEGSFTQAAERLNLTQPTVSQHIAALETVFNTQLIVRQPRHLQFTAIGQILLSHARRLLDLSDEAYYTIQEATGQMRRTLRIGVGHTLAIYLLPDLLRHLRDVEPTAEIVIRAGNTADLLAATADGQVDLALVGSPAEYPQVSITPFMHDELKVIISPSDPWRTRPHVSLSELRQRTLLTREAGSALHASVRELVGAAHLNGPQSIILGETEAIKRSVEAGLGVALIQGIAIQRELKQGILHTVPLINAPVERTYNIAQRVDHSPSVLTQLMIELLSKSPQMK